TLQNNPLISPAVTGARDLCYSRLGQWRFPTVITTPTKTTIKFKDCCVAREAFSPRLSSPHFTLPSSLAIVICFRAGPVPVTPFDLWQVVVKLRVIRRFVSPTGMRRVERGTIGVCEDAGGSDGRIRR